jgi:hypothetical protein
MTAIKDRLSTVYDNPFKDYENANHRGLSIKWKTLEQLDNFLSSFETNFLQTSHAKMIWADDAFDVQNNISKLIGSAQPKTVINWNNTASIELDLNAKSLNYKGPFLQKGNLQTTNNQLSTSKLFMEAPEENEKLDEQLEKYVLNKDSFSIISASYASADGLLFFNNENNALDLILNKSDQIIILLPINQIIPSSDDTELFNSLIAWNTTRESAVGNQKIVRQFDHEKNVYLLIYNNDRTTSLGEVEFRKVLYDYTYGQDLNANTSVAINANTPLDLSFSLDSKSILYKRIINSEDFSHLKFLPFIYKHPQSKFLLDKDFGKLIEQSIHRYAKNSTSNRSKWSTYFYKKMVSSRKNIELPNRKLKTAAFNFLNKQPNKNGINKFKIAKQSFAKQWQNQFK